MLQNTVGEETPFQYTSDSYDLDDCKPITFISGKFSDTQCNYTALVRDVITIYMSVKEFNLYLQYNKFTILYYH